MTTEPNKIIEDPDLAKVEPALLRAAERARDIARRTRTPLVIYENGQIKKEMINHDSDSLGQG